MTQRSQTTLWIPLPGPQTDAYHSAADELFYGGAAGGGKTDLAIGLAVTAHRRSRIFRRESTQLLGIIDRSREIIGDQGTFAGGQFMLWRLHAGPVIELAGVKDEADKRKYQGRPADLIEFDEITEFLESQYRFLIGWNRSTIPGQRCRVVCTGNPPTTPEGEWVIRYWAPWLDAAHPRPAEPGELRWFAVLDGKDVEVPDGTPFEHKGELITPRSRTFIPARLSDNPYLQQTGYAAVLQGMPEPLRSQMLYGDFTIGTTDDPWQVIPTAWVRAAQARWTDAHPRLPDGTRWPLTALGVDVARGGQDATVLSRRYGRWFAPLDKHPGTSTPDGQSVTRLVVAALLEGGYANIDVIGVGASVYDLCCQQIGSEGVHGVNVAAAAPGRDRTGKLTFVNLRAYAYWALREALDPERGDNLMLPPDRELMVDLCAPRWSMRAHGIQVEPKEDLIKRLGRSPDSGDALVLAHLQPQRMTLGPRIYD